MSGIAIGLFIMSLVSYNFIDNTVDNSNCEELSYSVDCIESKLDK